MSHASAQEKPIGGACGARKTAGFGDTSEPGDKTTRFEVNSTGDSHAEKPPHFGCREKVHQSTRDFEGELSGTEIRREDVH